MQDMELMNMLQELEKINKTGNFDGFSTIVEAFKQEQYPKVLYQISELRKDKPFDENTDSTLSLLEAICYIQVKEHDKAKSIIRNLLQNANQKDAESLLFLSELAFMCDYKLARRVATEALKQLETNEHQDRLKLARCYLILGEAEENMEKLPRSAKYYRKALDYFSDSEERDRHMHVFLQFKLGMIYAAMNQVDNAIHFHQKVIDMSPNKGQENLRIHSMISIGKIYGSQEIEEEATTYLNRALVEIADTSLQDTYTHAEALTEMAFYYFDQGLLEKALPLYEHAVNIYTASNQVHHRKLGMVYMQYAYCLEHKERSEIATAGQVYEQAITTLETANDLELLENALADVIAFFDMHNPKKKRKYENKFVEWTKKSQEYEGKTDSI